MCDECARQRRGLEVCVKDWGPVRSDLAPTAPAGDWDRRHYTARCAHAIATADGLTRAAASHEVVLQLAGSGKGYQASCMKFATTPFQRNGLLPCATGLSCTMIRRACRPVTGKLPGDVSQMSLFGGVTAQDHVSVCVAHARLNAAKDMLPTGGRAGIVAHHRHGAAERGEHSAEHCQHAQPSLRCRDSLRLQLSDNLWSKG